MSYSFRRRLYLLASQTIIGLQGLVYLVLVALWGTRALDHHLFSLTRLGSISRTISVISQAFIISSLAALTFFAQALASDRIVRQRAYFNYFSQVSSPFCESAVGQKLAALQDLLDAWKGLGPSIASLWRGRRLGSTVQYRLLLILSFFVASSLLQILVPATVTVQSTNLSVPRVLDALRLSNVTNDDLAMIQAGWLDNGTLSFHNSFYYAMDEQQSPPGVQQGFVDLKSRLLPCCS